LCHFLTNIEFSEDETEDEESSEEDKEEETFINKKIT